MGVFLASASACILTIIATMLALSLGHFRTGLNVSGSECVSRASIAMASLIYYTVGSRKNWKFAGMSIGKPGGGGGGGYTLEHIPRSSSPPHVRSGIIQR